MPLTGSELVLKKFGGSRMKGVLASSCRLTLDFVRLNAAPGGLEGWPIPNIQQTMTRLGTLKPTVFALIDFTAGYHQTELDKHSEITCHG